MDAILLKLLVGAVGVQFTLIAWGVKILFDTRVETRKNRFQMTYQAGEIANMRGQYKKIETWVDNNKNLMQFIENQKEHQEQLEKKDLERDAERKRILHGLGRASIRIDIVLDLLNEVNKFLGRPNVNIEELVKKRIEQLKAGGS